MTLLQALAYFSREATLNLLRGWKVSLLAVLTIAVSLFLIGLFLLVGGNARSVVEGWRAESRVVLYLETGTSTERVAALQARLDAEPWTARTEIVTPAEASSRFRQAFPSLSGLLDGWGEEPLPTSIEIEPAVGIASSRVAAALDALAEEPTISMVDDDRDWLDQVDTLVLVLEGLALLLGGVLLTTAVFTIGSVIRLTAYLYEDEIAVMRMVGATEFFIRGPFYLEGALQGLLGGLVAIACLAIGFGALRERMAGSIGSLITQNFLSIGQLGALVGLGATAGLAGSILSLRRERLGRTAETSPRDA